MGVMMTVSCVTVSVNRVSVWKTVSRCQSTGWRCRVGWSWGWGGVGVGGSLTNIVSCVTVSQGVSFEDCVCQQGGYVCNDDIAM